MFKSLSTSFLTEKSTQR